jgi:hypothetical protein
MVSPSNLTGVSADLVGVKAGNRGLLPLGIAVVAALVCGVVIVRGLIGDVASAARAAAPGATTGIAVYDLRDNAYRVRSDESVQFPAESVVKLLIAVDALSSKSSAKVPQVQRMLSLSDDTIANQLWDTNGGPAVVTRATALIGLKHTSPPADPDRWGDTMITASDVVGIYQYLVSSHQQTILDALHTAAHTASDGYDQFFGIPNAVGGQPWWIKQGWGCCKPDRVLNTTGLVGADKRYVIVVLSKQSASTDPGAAGSAVTNVVKALMPALG